MSLLDVDRIQARIKQCPTEDSNDAYITGKQVMITTVHEIKDAFNSDKLEKLNGVKISFPAKDKYAASRKAPDLSKFNEKQLKGLPNHLDLKVDCPIMITSNIRKGDKLTNGTFGRVVAIDEENLIVWCRFEGDTGAQTRLHHKVKYCEDTKAVPIDIKRETVRVNVDDIWHTFRRVQFPLVLAYAITCYAAQGITRETVIIDFGKSTFKHGAFFVAFSRCTSLAGIYLKSFKPEMVYCDPNVNTELRRLQTTASLKFRNSYFSECNFVNSKSKEPCQEIKTAY